MNSLLRDDLRKFLIQNGLYASALDADSIMRRLDNDRDGRLTCTDFFEYIDAVSSANFKDKKNQRTQIKLEN